MQSVRDLLELAAGPRGRASEFGRAWSRGRRLRTWRAVGIGSLTLLLVLASVAVGAAIVRDRNAATIPPAGPVGTWIRITDAPIAGVAVHQTIWTGRELVILGTDDPEGQPKSELDSGAAYDPQTDTWREIARSPLKGSGQTLVWTGDEVIVWGGEVGDGTHGRPDQGAAYDPRLDEWNALPPSPTWSIAGHTAIWTGTEVIVWGGINEGNSQGPFKDTGASYDPSTRTWRRLALAPLTPRANHVAVWTGSEVVVWGGSDHLGKPLDDGAAYDPTSDSWRSLPPPPLAPRWGANAAWTGNEMIIWGGGSLTGNKKTRLDSFADGAAYDPRLDQWRPIAEAPVGDFFDKTPAAWTGSDLIIYPHQIPPAQPMAYDAARDRWFRLPKLPGDRLSPAMAWVGDGLVAWGGVRAPEQGSTEGTAGSGEDQSNDYPAASDYLDSGYLWRP